jgi:hypothetical protein
MSEEFTKEEVRAFLENRKRFQISAYTYNGIIPDGPSFRKQLEAIEGEKQEATFAYATDSFTDPQLPEQITTAKGTAAAQSTTKDVKVQLV